MFMSFKFDLFAEIYFTSFKKDDILNKIHLRTLREGNYYG